MNKKKLAVAFAALAAIGFAVKLAFFRRPFLYAGTLDATDIDLSSRLAETIAEVVPQEGDRVTRGEVVIRLVCDDVKVEDDLATINYRRGLKLFNAGTISPDTMDQLTNRKQDADVRLSWCEIRAPLDAMTLNRYHEPGEMVNIGTKILTIANIKDIWAYIYVPMPLVAKLYPGEKLIGYLPELGMKPFVGHIWKINDEAEFTPKNVQTREERQRLIFGVKVSFLGSNEQEILKPGMTIEVALPR
jgi:HlyD family secretion protein